MKKLLPLAFICLIGFYACKKDSDNKSTKIIGKWTISKVVSIKIVNGADSVAEVDDNLGSDTYLQFNNDGSAISHSNGMNEAAHYTLTGNVLLISEDNPSATYSFTVKTLTSTSLVLRQKDDEVGVYYGDTYFTR